MQRNIEPVSGPSEYFFGDWWSAKFTRDAWNPVQRKSSREMFDNCDKCLCNIALEYNLIWNLNTSRRQPQKTRQRFGGGIRYLEDVFGEDSLIGNDLRTREEFLFREGCLASRSLMFVFPIKIMIANSNDFQTNLFVFI